MNKYKISSYNPSNRFFRITFEAFTRGEKHTEIQLPAWRPGRYELANFAKNIRKFSAISENGNAMNFQKITKDRWKIDTEGVEKFTVEYEYYSADLNAGSTFSDEKFWYINPVNCCVYIPGREDEKCYLELDIPPFWKIACGMKPNDAQGNIFESGSFHELADSPLIASPDLKHAFYSEGNCRFHIWIQGECKPDFNRIVKDFSAFTRKQIQSFGEFPVNEYHFLIHVLPFNFYHGVEHLTSSVNALGPGYELMQERYSDLLGLCSHELYHAWNIKSIRPAEMFPYDYSRENYFQTGYVAEGVTTYMGDLYLLLSGVFNLQDFLYEMSLQLQKHMDNPGRKNYSVAESSFDTWLDGYVPGIPERKVSIYTEGCLLAFIADVLIFRNTDHTKRLSDVIKVLYTDFSQQGKGYTEEDYKKLLSEFSGMNMDSFFQDLVHGKVSYLPLLEECLGYLGLKMESGPPPNHFEFHFGIKAAEQGEKTIVTSVSPEGEGAKAGLLPGDQLISINQIIPRGDAAKWLNYFSEEEITLEIARGPVTRNVNLKPGKDGFSVHRITVNGNASAKQSESLKKWIA